MGALKCNGFSIVELLIVLSIAGILVAVGRGIYLSSEAQHVDLSLHEWICTEKDSSVILVGKMIMPKQRCVRYERVR